MGIEAILGLVIPYGYWIVFAAIFLDNAGLPIPGELLLLIFGALARNGDFSLSAGLLIASAAAMSGDTIGYWLGRLTGDRALRTYCRATLGSGACIPRAVSYYHHYGPATVIVGRFVMGVRAFLSPLAGSARMPFGRFLLFDSVGALLWSGVFMSVGYAFGWRVAEGIRNGSAVLFGIALLGSGVYVVAKLLRRRRHGGTSLREGAVARVVAALANDSRRIN